MSSPAIGARYDELFEGLGGPPSRRKRGVFVPFFMLGDPDLATSARLLRCAIDAGADALEVGIPFSDPVADGPAIQRAALRARAGGATLERCLALVAEIHRDAPRIPIGVLTYANLVVHRGIDRFYRGASAAGVDSVLIADVPSRESALFSEAARAHGVAPILIAPQNAPLEVISRIAELSNGYTYVVARKGVTGANDRLSLSHGPLFEALRAKGAPPPLLGFGVSRPEHIRAALDGGATGAISGSAIATRIEEHTRDPDAMLAAVRSFVGDMCAACVA